MQRIPIPVTLLAALLLSCASPKFATITGDSFRLSVKDSPWDIELPSQKYVLVDNTLKADSLSGGATFRPSLGKFSFGVNVATADSLMTAGQIRDRADSISARVFAREAVWKYDHDGVAYLEYLITKVADIRLVRYMRQGFQVRDGKQITYTIVVYGYIPDTDNPIMDEFIHGIRFVPKIRLGGGAP